MGLFTDDFNRADSDLSGAVWYDNEGDAKVFSNQVRAASSGAALATPYLVDAPPSADYYTQIVVATNPSGGMGEGAIARGVVGAQTYYMGICANNNVYIYKRVTGTFTALASKALVSFPMTIKLTVSGTSLTLHINGVQELTASDSAISAAGFAGLYIQGAVLNDNFETTGAPDVGHPMLARRRGLVGQTPSQPRGRRW